MSYSTGIMDKRLTVLTRQAAQSSAFGSGSGGYTYTPTKTVWCNVEWTRGTKAMRDGALDAYDVVMIRTRWHEELTRECRVSVDNKIYQIDSYHADKKANTIQITGTEVTA